MKLAYLGTPHVGVPPLHALVEAGHDIRVVVSQPDRKRGRGVGLSPSPVKAAALELGLPVDDSVDAVLDSGAELGVVVAFGQLIKPHVLAKLPFINLHFSLLPRWRGAAPMERAFLAGDTETGVCVMALEEGLDTGGVYRRVVTPIDDEDTGDSLRSRLVQIGTDMLVESLRAGTVEALGEPIPQTGEPTWAKKFSTDEFEIDWSNAAASIDRLVRLGGAFTFVRGKRLKVGASRVVPESGPAGTVLRAHIIACGDGAIELIRVQPEGKSMMDAKDWGNGVQLAVHEQVGRS